MKTDSKFGLRFPKFFDFETDFEIQYDVGIQQLEPKQSWDGTPIMGEGFWDLVFAKIVKR